jgi:damage-control phosphatase, subfamily I
MFNQIGNTLRLVTDDPAVHMEAMRRLAEYVTTLSLDQTPAAVSQRAYAIVSELTGVADPYADNKALTNQAALDILPDIRRAVDTAGDPLDIALHAAVAGNIIDMGIGLHFDIERDVLAMLDRPFAINAIDDLRAELQPGVRIVYLGDNAGEIVFDTLLVEQLLRGGADVIFTVKSGPIINDATLADADFCGMTKLCRVIATGAADIGVNWDHVSDEFRDAVAGADLLIAKGHGNFETSNARPENFYFLLKAKCELVAAELGVTLGDIVFKHIPRV